MYIVFTGNWPGNVSKAAKYSIKWEEGKWVVGIVYDTDFGERWYPTTDEHPELVKMVNEIKKAENGIPGGPFYINEYKQVIVPAGTPVEYYLAGEYEGILRFEFEGIVITGEPITPDGGSLNPGDIWVGPKVGIPYILTGGGNDIMYKRWTRPGVETKYFLSKTVGREKANKTIKQVLNVKGYQGGRFYVNEHLALFAPMGNSDGQMLQYIYIGQLDLEHWFPKPSKI